MPPIARLHIALLPQFITIGGFPIVTENQENAIATSTTLYRSLCAIADKYFIADVIEKLALIASEVKQ